MKTTPIYDALRREMPEAPLCRICGDLALTLGGYSGTCTECFVLDREAQPELWHCVDCGEFLRGFDRCVSAPTGRRPVFVCAEHATERSAAA